MGLKELGEFVDSEDAAVVTEYLASKGYKTAEDIAGLERKKDELLEKVSKGQANKKATTELFDKYKIVDLDDLSVKLATLAGAQEKESDLENMARRLKLIEQTAEEDKERAGQEKALRVNSEKKSQILSALKGVHVDDVSLDLLSPYFANKVNIEEENGKINLVVTTDDGSSPLKSFIEDWSKTDEAKRYIKAPANFGGGSNGSGGGGGVVMTQEQIAALPNRNDRLKAMAELAKTT
jgi:hypothetical protein